MNQNALILERLIDEDFGIITKEGSRWAKGETHDSLVVDKERGIFYWNSKIIVGDPLKYLMEVRGLPFSQAREYLKQFDSYSDVFVYSANNQRGDVVVYPKLIEAFFNEGKKSKERREYMYNRGLTDYTLDRFQVGWYNDYIMIPMFENGTFMNFQMRTDTPTKRIKSYYSGIGAVLFNSDVLKYVDQIMYVEGPVDAMILEQNGIHAIASNSGGGYKKEWYGKFLYQKEINILFDNDPAGLNEAKRLARFLGSERCKIYTFDDFDEKAYDPVDFFRDGYSKDDLINLINTKAKHIYELE